MLVELKKLIDKLQFPNLKLKVKDTHQSKAGLFVYDIFWVFFTPVMVSVAKSFDAPIKLLFPTADSARPFSMLGLGDIVIPAERRVVPGSCGEEFKFASFMAVTLSCDHRVIDVIYQGY